MATKLPSKMPGSNRRRFENRESQNKKSSPFDKSPVLNSQNNSSGSRTHKPDRSPENSEPRPSAIQDSVPTKRDSRAGNVDLIHPDKTSSKKSTLPNGDSLATKEKAASASDGQDGATNKKEDDLNYSGSRKNPKKNKKKGFFGRLSRQKKIAAGFGASGIIGLALFGLTLVQGPFQLLQFSQFLQRAHFGNGEAFGNDRSSRITILYRYWRTGTAQGTRLGGITGRYADRWETKLVDSTGLRPVYDNGIPGRMRGFEVIDPQKAQSYLTEFNNEGIDVNGSNANVNAGRYGETVTGPIIDLGDASPGNDPLKRKAIKSVVGGVDINGVSEALGRRTLTRLGGVKYHPLNLKRRAGEALVDFYNRIRGNRTEDIKNGAPDPDARRAQGSNQVDADGNPILDADGNPIPEPGSIDAAGGGNDLIDDAVDAGRTGRLPELNARVKLGLRIAGGATAAVGALCVVRDLGQQAEVLQFANTILPMMRIGFEFIAVGSQIQAFTDITLDEIGYYASLLYDPLTGLGAMAALTSQVEAGNPPTGPDIEAAAKPSNVDGQPLLFDIINGIPGINVACGVEGFISSIPIIGDVIDLAGSIQNGAINTFLGAPPLNTSIEELMDSVVAWLAGEAVDATARGAKLANYAHYGARLAANLASLGKGGRELTAAESGALHNEQLERIAYENSKKGVFDRYFNLNSIDSLAAKSLINTPTTPAAAFASLLKGPQTLANSLTQPAYAQTPYDYGFAEVGFSAEERDNSLVADPFANAEAVEPRLAELTSAYGECFPATVTLPDNPDAQPVLFVDTFTNPDMTTQFNNDDSCNDPTNEELLQYRMYLSDTITSKSLACYEGDEDACIEVGFADVAESAPVTIAGGPVTVQGDLAFPLAVTKAQVGGGIFQNGDTNQAGHPYIAYDLIAAEGTTTVSMTDGVVVRVSSACGGNTAAITVNIPEQGISIWYGHQDPATVVVSEGQTVTAGTPLAQLVNSGVDCMSGADHLHIDATVNVGDDIYRPACSRASCTTQDRFRSIGPQLYELYQALPDN